MDIKTRDKIKKRITVIDYGMGNIHSICSAVKFLGYETIVSHDHNVISNSSHIILPGVGEFGKAMSNLQNLGLVDLLKKIGVSKKIKILGICLGMQLLAETSEEGPIAKGLGLIPGHIVSLNKFDAPKVPHIGFNEVIFPRNSILGQWTDSPKDFYFVHSYCLSQVDDEEKGSKGITEYGAKFISLYEKDPIYATQFHPEKSQTNGLYLINSFLQL